MDCDLRDRSCTSRGKIASPTKTNEYIVAWVRVLGSPIGPQHFMQLYPAKPSCFLLTIFPKIVHMIFVEGLDKAVAGAWCADECTTLT